MKQENTPRPAGCHLKGSFKRDLQQFDNFISGFANGDGMGSGDGTSSVGTMGGTASSAGGGTFKSGGVSSAMVFFPGAGAFGGVEGGVSYMIKFAFDQGKPFY